MERINYKSDFDFLLRLHDCNGDEIGWPDYDWTAIFWTSMKANSVAASCIRGNATNCYNDNGVIHVVLNGHKLSPGKLQVEFIAELPNDVYPDRKERIVVPVPLEIELIREAAPCPQGFEIDLVLPYIKGEPFTYQDFTPEQIAELQRPATEAATRADAAAINAVNAANAANETVTAIRGFLEQAEADKSELDAAEEARQEAEAGRIEAENTRKSFEDSRVEAESARVEAEAARVRAEDTRKSFELQRINKDYERTNAETARKEAEEERTRAETARATAENGRVDAENTRESAENTRKSAETARVTAESARATAEAERKNAENGRASAETGRVDAETARVTAENTRATAEDRRVTAEDGRATAEQTRVTAEGKRAEAESSRASSEEGRKTSESQRKEAENARKASEQSRTANETTRGENEQARKNAEAGRVSAETAREAAESDRAKEFATFADQIAAKVDRQVYDEGQQAQDKRLTDIEEYVTGNSANPELFRRAKNLAVGAWNHEDLNPDAVDFYGDKAFADCWHFVLVDCEAPANEDGTQPIVGELKRNNLLRFADGGFAPTVGITEAMRAECDVELYLDQAHTQKWCDAGAFDAEAFYAGHGMAKLYNAEGAEVRVLRPWETTETKYSIFLASDKTLYPIDRLVGGSGTEWSGVMEEPLEWDGLDVGKFALAPTGITPAPFCTVNDKARCFFFAYEADHAYCRSSAGTNNAVTLFSNGRTYPRCNDVSQASAGTKSRANNADPAASYPFAEGGQHAHNVYNLCLEAKYGTKNLNDSGKWGTGISSNNTCNSEETWLANGGVRYRMSGTGVYKYQTFAAQPAELYYTADGSKHTYWSDWLNKEYPKEQCMEAQMAMSFANETGVAEGVRFEFYGGEYWYYDVPETDRAYMSARVYKIMSQQGCSGAYDAGGEAVTFDVDVILRMSLYDGATLSGDIFSYDNGGCFLIGKYNGEHTGNDMRAYLEPDQREWGPVQTVLSGAADHKWPFEETYIPLGEYTQLGNAWMRERQSWSTGKLVNGGNSSSGECAYNYDHCYWASGAENIGRLYLVGVRSRISAYYSYCARRSVSCSYGYGNTYRINCASAQVLLPRGWRSRGATPGKA